MSSRVTFRITDTTPSVRRAARLALGKLAGHDDLSELLEIYGDADTEVRQRIAEKLLNISKPEDLTLIAQKAARYSSAGSGSEIIAVLTKLDQKFYAPFKEDLDDRPEPMVVYPYGFVPEDELV